MRTKIGNLRARAAGIDAVRGALFGANDNHIGRAQRVSPRRNTSGSPPRS